MMEIGLTLLKIGTNDRPGFLKCYLVNFIFRNRISLLFTLRNFPIVLTRLGGLRSRSYITRKILVYNQESIPGW